MTTTTKYYDAGVAQAVNVAGTLSYLVQDSLGSVSVALDNAGNVTATALYFPYGGVRYATGTMPTSFGFTGQRQDPSGLDFFVGRYYDPTVGQFTSADVFQGPNRYNYVGNNPSSGTDPSGNGVIPTRPLVDGCGATGATYCPSPLRARPLSAPASWSTPCDYACDLSAMVTGLDAIIAPFTYAAQASQALGAPQWVVDGLYGLASLTGEPVPVGQQLFDLAMWLASLSSAAGGGASGIGAAIGAAANAALSSGMLHALGEGEGHAGGGPGTGNGGGGTGSGHGNSNEGGGSGNGTGSGGQTSSSGNSGGSNPPKLYRGTTTPTPPQGSDIRIGTDVKPDPNGMLNTSRGYSTFTTPRPSTQFPYWWSTDPSQLPSGLTYNQYGRNLDHFEIGPAYPMTVQDLINLFNQIKWLP